MLRTISIPFRVGLDGRIASHPTSSDAIRVQRIAEIVGTLQGERPLDVGFGIEDPVWSTVSPAAVALQARLYGPFDARITGVEQAADGERHITLRYELAR